MIALLSTLALRSKIWLAGAAIVGLSLLGLWTAWRLAANRAKDAQQRAKSLEAAREAEKRIRNRQDALRLKQTQLREALKAKTERDHFESGWGP